MSPVIATLILVFLGWTLFSLWSASHGKFSAATPFRMILILLSVVFLIYTTRFELLQQWPEFTLRLPSFFFSFPHSSLV